MWSDLRHFFSFRPAIPTRIRFASKAEHQAYSQRILQRLGTPVQDYSVLNIHKIGIDVPVRYVFEELLNWNGDSTCWPNHLAMVERLDGGIENFRIFALGRKKPAPSRRHGLFGLTSWALFQLSAIRIQRHPDPSDVDNARYLCFECKGGYPIGIFAMYARSSIPSEHEMEPTQLFMLVSFDFFGWKRWPRLLLPILALWGHIHDRVTSNVLNRFKQLCEWRFSKIRQQLSNSLPEHRLDGLGAPASPPGPGD